MQPEKLAEYLRRFYGDVTSKHGEEYNTCSVINIRAGLNRHLTSPPWKLQINLVHGKPFQSADQVITANSNPMFYNNCHWIHGHKAIMMEPCFFFHYGPASVTMFCPLIGIDWQMWPDIYCFWWDVIAMVMLFMIALNNFVHASTVQRSSPVQSIVVISWLEHGWLGWKWKDINFYIVVYIFIGRVIKWLVTVTGLLVGFIFYILGTWVPRK